MPAEPIVRVSESAWLCLVGHPAPRILADSARVCAGKLGRGLASAAAIRLSVCSPFRSGTAAPQHVRRRFREPEDLRAGLRNLGHVALSGCSSGRREPIADEEGRGHEEKFDDDSEDGHVKRQPPPAGRSARVRCAHERVTMWLRTVPMSGSDAQRVALGAPPCRAMEPGAAGRPRRSRSARLGQEAVMAVRAASTPRSSRCRRGAPCRRRSA